jgi:hypothetical protein
VYSVRIPKRLGDDIAGGLGGEALGKCGEGGCQGREEAGFGCGGQGVGFPVDGMVIMLVTCTYRQINYS